MRDTALARAWIEPAALRGVLRAYAEAEASEPCGVLLGRIEARAARIREAPSLPNSHPRPAEAFRMSPEDLLDVVRGARNRGLTVVGFWHGHLAGPPVPGAADEEGMAAAEALGPSARFLVIVGRGGGTAPVARAYVRGPHGLRELPLGT